ncbi:hypothetical protein SDC9_69998 [bioreactor metagenome]|uniref:Uncharacterized protein n=1 Tax=bioreactor metagenome TaxID=1076179 RepID=A0A644YBM2_9ZZZZ
MKRTFCKLVTILIMIGTLVGCQKTPKNVIVVEKNLDQILAEADLTSDDKTQASHLDVPDILSAEVESLKGKLRVHVNAPITVPQIDKFSIMRVNIGDFSQEQAQRLFNTLCADSVPVATDAPQTKSMYQETVQKLIDQRESGNLGKYDSLAELDEAIDSALQKLETLPEKSVRVDPDFSFYDRGDGDKEILIRAIYNESEMSELSIYNAAPGIGSSRVEYYRDLSQYAELTSILNSPQSAFLNTKNPNFTEPTMSFKDAKELAEYTISQLGLDDFICSGNRMSAIDVSFENTNEKHYKGIYEFMFTRAFSGVAITYSNDDGNIGGYSEGYSQPWMYEKIRIIIDDEGILSFKWNSPYELGGIIVENSSLLSFNDIQAIFEKMIVIKDNRYDTDESDDVCNMYITDARLGYARVTEKDVGATGLIIPVWDFFGYYVYGDEVWGSDGYESMLTINAVDGSIIDRKLGY